MRVASFIVATKHYEIIVIGGGHAGVEAAWAAANCLGGNHSVALVTLDPSKIGVMSCNPAIGGLAKGQLVREVDALGGLMGLATDATGIQFRVLNTTKGPAVHGPRAQCDKHAYASAVQLLIASRPEIEVVQGSVEALEVEDVSSNFRSEASSRVLGVRIDSLGLSRVLHARAIVLTTGTFMQGLMHSGQSMVPGGRFGEAAAIGISDALKDLGFELGRLKTGTPPRLLRSSIAWDQLVAQWGDEHPRPFSVLTSEYAKDSHAEASSLAPNPDRVRGHRAGHDKGAVARALETWKLAGFVSPIFPMLPQVECRQTRTTHAAHELIRANLHRAPMYSGQIESAGPRYCPSIEDKVVRFAERSQHGVFLEPESHADNWIYCNGISTSLPADVQDAIVRSMPGCERAEVLRYGYAVEYDMVRPHQIRATCETKLVEGLFLAGQINGTSGYEEAAAQGLIAGLNAARRVRGESEVMLGRERAYIGVLMDDLCTKTPVEPYRMFTSRAEHRLLLRADNAPDRLTALADEVGLLRFGTLGAIRKARHLQREVTLSLLGGIIDSKETRIESVPLARKLVDATFSQVGLRMFLCDHPRVRDFEKTQGILISSDEWTTAFADRRYAAYVARERRVIARRAEMEHRKLPEGIDYTNLPHLRNETRQALVRFRPATFGQASRLEGMTPADLTLLSVLLSKPAHARGLVKLDEPSSTHTILQIEGDSLASQADISIDEGP